LYLIHCFTVTSGSVIVYIFHFHRQQKRSVHVGESLQCPHHNLGGKAAYLLQSKLKLQTSEK